MSLERRQEITKATVVASSFVAKGKNVVCVLCVLRRREGRDRGENRRVYRERYVGLI